MSVMLITGVPGCGKSYYAVHKIYSDLKSGSDKFILSNIEGLELDSSHYEYIDFHSSKDLFIYSNFKQFIETIRERHSLPPDTDIDIYLDEAQRIIPYELRDSEVVYTFDYHRHLGVNFFLITQHERKISPRISSLVEIQARGVPDKINPVPMYFIYKISAGGEQYRKEKLRKSDEIFSLYKSFDAGKVGKKDYNMLIKLVIVLLILAVGIYSMTRFFGGRSSNDTTTRPDLSVSSNHVTNHVPQSVESESDIELYHDTDFIRSQLYYPIPDAYLKDRDLLLIDGNVISVEYFITEYDILLHGLQYFYSPGKKFVIMTDSHEILFPHRRNIQYLAHTHETTQSDLPNYERVDIPSKDSLYHLSQYLNHLEDYRYYSRTGQHSLSYE